MNKRLKHFSIAFFLVFTSFVYAGGNTGGEHGNLISSIGISIIVATITAFLGHMAKQPLLLAYIAAGVVIGPNVGFSLVESESDIAVISEIGLILLLFMIGLEIDVKKLKESGKTLVVSGIMQFIISLILGFFFFSYLGFSVTAEKFDLIYLMMCCSLSSTAIVVKVLYGKFELDTLAGNITLGVLIFQDIWAILFLSVQPNLSNPEVLNMLLSFGKGILLVVSSLLVSKYVLPKFFNTIAKVPELVLVASLGWCFFVCSMANYLNLSIEMGALIAGVAISTFPYNLDVIAKVINIRDFFVTLFFVALGMQVPNPMENIELIKIAFIIVLFVIAARFLSLYPLLYLFKNGHRVSILSSVNLANVSEFSLVICSLGLAASHIDNRILTLMIFTFVISSIFAPYFIKYNDKIQRFLTKIFVKIGIKDIGDKEELAKNKLDKDVVILGFFRVASSLIKEIEDSSTEFQALKEKLLIVDLNPDVNKKLKIKGIDAVYGDISHMDTLHHANIHNAKIVISTIPDTILVGTDNLKLIKKMKSICPNAKIIVTAESVKRALTMYKEGADYVLLPRITLAEHLLPVINNLLNDTKSMAALKESEIARLKIREEIIS